MLLNHLPVRKNLDQPNPVYLPGIPAADKPLDPHPDFRRPGRLNRRHLVFKLRPGLIPPDLHRPVQTEPPKRLFQRSNQLN